MSSLRQLLGNRVRASLKKLGIDADPHITPSNNPKFGDYQSNCAMSLAKAKKRNPRELAAEIIEHLDVDGIADQPEIAGGGFINFRITPAFLAERLSRVPADSPDGDRVGVPPVENPQTTVVDFSSPNLAKQMHIGHLRSTVIGECICRVLEFSGHHVHRENHVGDWGTQFGMLVAYMRRKRPDAVEDPDSLIVNDLEAFYVEAKQLFDEDESFKTEARQTVVQLQQGDESTRKIWQVICDVSLRHCHEIYRRLDVSITDVGESFYQELMHEVVSRLETMRDEGADWIRESDGAFCVFPEGYVNKDGEPVPEIVRKSDGGFGYFGSDLATIIDRVERLEAERIIYVVGTQTAHLQNVFATARRTGWAKDVELIHLKFGNILAPNGKPFKTREGGTYKLKDVLDEAVERARGTVEEQMQADPDGRRFDESEVRRIAEIVGLGAVKYYDMARALQGDYKFDLDSMCSLEGNTAPYMMYAYARIKSIARKAGVDLSTMGSGAIKVEHATEIELGLKLLQFGDAVETVARDLKPNVLTDYLYDLAKSFSRFYDKSIGVRVVDAPEAWRESRLRLCDLTARTLKKGLSLLGIGTVEQM